jgi:K+-sensing histidine kinase KdpD
MREDQLKKDLSNLIVHDMKNPLFVIQGNLQMMALVKNEKVNDKTDVYTQRIERSSRSLLRMILNLLDISRLEQKQLVLEPTQNDLNSILKEIVNSFKDIPEHETKSTHIKLDQKLSNIYVDKEIFERILDNLFNYVFQNTPEYKSILIETEEMEDHRILLRISHDGPRIPIDYQKKIFLKHAQPDLRKAGFKPARGLGLIFCKLALDMQKGNVFLEPDYPGGNSFILQLPTLKYFKNGNTSN